MGVAEAFSGPAVISPCHLPNVARYIHLLPYFLHCDLTPIPASVDIEVDQYIVALVLVTIGISHAYRGIIVIEAADMIGS